MKKIKVRDHVLSGNLINDDGWNEVKSAHNFAHLLTNEYHRYLKNNYPDDIDDVYVHVEFNATGISNELDVIVDLKGTYGDVAEYNAWKIENHLRDILPEIREHLHNIDFDKWAVKS